MISKVLDFVFLTLLGSIAKALCRPFEATKLHAQSVERAQLAAKVEQLEQRGMTGTMIVNKTFRFPSGAYVRYAHLQYVLFDKNSLLVARRFRNDLTAIQGRGKDHRGVACALHNEYL